MVFLDSLAFPAGWAQLHFNALANRDDTFLHKTRDIFRAALTIDDATWERGRGWALSVGLIALPYYQNTNPILAAISRHAIDQVLAEHKQINPKTTVTNLYHEK